MLIFWRDIAGAMDPAIIRGHFGVDTLEVTVNRLPKILTENAHHAPHQMEDEAGLVEELENL